MSCFRKLHLPESATLEDVKAQWHRLAAEHHPDKGGDAIEFANYSRAYRTALAVLGKQDCTACLGTKQVPAEGFTFTYVTCPACSGR